VLRGEAPRQVQLRRAPSARARIEEKRRVGLDHHGGRSVVGEAQSGLEGSVRLGVPDRLETARGLRPRERSVGGVPPDGPAGFEDLADQVAPQSPPGKEIELSAMLPAFGQAHHFLGEASVAHREIARPVAVMRFPQVRPHRLSPLARLQFSHPEECQHGRAAPLGVPVLRVLELVDESLFAFGYPENAGAERTRPFVRTLRDGLQLLLQVRQPVVDVWRQQLAPRSLAGRLRNAGDARSRRLVAVKVDPLIEIVPVVEIIPRVIVPRIRIVLFPKIRLLVELQGERLLARVGAGEEGGDDVLAVFAHRAGTAAERDRGAGPDDRNLASVGGRARTSHSRLDLPPTLLALDALERHGIGLPVGSTPIHPLWREKLGPLGFLLQESL